MLITAKDNINCLVSEFEPMHWNIILIQHLPLQKKDNLYEQQMNENIGFVRWHEF